MESKSPHRGITMHRLPVGGDFPGIIFAVGSVVIFLLAIPALWVVTVAALAAGCLIAAALQLVRSKTTESNRLILKL